jgi:hypothetical protein
MKLNFRVQGSHRIVASPATAAEYLKLASLPGERRLHADRVEFYKNQMIAGQWLETIIASVFVKEQKKEYRLNGQHTMAALQLCPKDLRIPVLWTHYEVNALPLAAMLYANFDRIESTRKQNEILRPFLDSTGRKSWTTKLGGMVVGALAFHELGRKWSYSSDIKREDRMLLLNRYATEATVLYDFLAPQGSAPHIARTPVVAAFLEMYRKDAKAAVEFGEQVKNGENLRRGHPAHTLRERLLRSTLATTKGRASGQLTSGPDMYAWCINAWNALRAGESIRSLRGVYGNRGEAPVAR